MSSSEKLSHQESSGSVGQMVSQRLSPSLINLEHLSEEERNIILLVLERDEQLRQHDQERVKKRARTLKNELYELRRKGAVKAADENDNTRACIRCREPLGLLFNTGDSCPKCQHKVCKACQVILPSGTRWLCTVCHKNMQIQLETGEWHYSKLQVDSVPLFGSDLVKASLAKARHSQKDPTTLPILTASDLRSDTRASLQGKQHSDPGRGRHHKRRQDSRTSSEYASSRQDSWRSASSGSEPVSVTDSSEVDAVIEPISGFTFQRVSFRKDHKGSEKQESSKGTLDQGRDSQDMGCVCSEQESSCIPAGLPEDDQDYYIKSNGKTPVSNYTSDSIEAPVISVNVVDDSKGKEDSEEEDIDQHFMVHGRLTPDNRNQFGGSSVSMTSLYSQAGEANYGKYVITGDINFGLNYNYKTSVFEVKIKACRDLAPVDVKKIKSDPYVKTYLLPDKTKASKRKTFVRKGTVNPQFEMTLRYHISQSELETRTLSVTVWNNDAFGRNDFLGEVLVNMDSVNLDDYKPRWHQLCNKSQPAEGAVAYKGDLTISLMYSDTLTQEAEEKNSKKKKKKDKSKKLGKTHPSADEGKGVLYVKVIEARNLVGVRMGGSSNPFVKGYLEPDRSKTGKHKTAVLRGTCNPRWDHVMAFENVSLKSLKERCLELTVWDHETLSSNEFLGGTRLNLGTGEYQRKLAGWNDATGEEMKAWEQMLKTRGQWISATIILRPSMISRLQFT
ncbi:synaptotagmin-like protein 4 isoform X8 [Acanthaster planci]|uniref:Synaptotagmin-like protein 4 isoform X8 n=1 Tax=Acanthaster planci TaxID=133434 RepID=A0A8B7ZHI9_ACAPL|nr:synaptotagmin-like protein 4 isoform X8 [Acanthaster planci]